MASATFLGPDGQDPGSSILKLRSAFVPTVGDGLWAGGFARARIRDRTQRGVDVNEAAFAPYSTKGPDYFYPNKSARSSSRTPLEIKQARTIAARGRYIKTGKVGKRTIMGIRYDSYAAAKAAHGRSGVDLFGLEQHPHMLNAMIVKAGGSEASEATNVLGPDNDEMSAFEQNQPNSEIRLGFYGDEADRAKGNNEGTRTVPQRNFFALNQEDLDLMSDGIGRRMITRAGHR